MNTDADRLKTLKVVDLRQILTQAAIQIPTRANKADLVSKILSTPEALQVFNQLYGIQETPTEEVENTEGTWDGESEARTTAPTEITTAPVLSEVHTFEGINGAPLNQSDQDKDSADTPKTDVLSRVEDEEEHKRRQRAQRFGIPVVEPVVTKKTKGKSKTLTIEATPNELEARAQRFGAVKNESGSILAKAEKKGIKRPVPEEQSDPAEVERLRKRAERFGL